MPSDPSKKNGHPYLSARERVEHDIAQLAQARRISVIVDIDPGGASPQATVHQIRLAYGRRTRIVTVDHETFMDDEFFRTLVVHQLRAAIDDIASPP